MIDDDELLALAKKEVPPEQEEIAIDPDIQEFIYQLGIKANPNCLVPFKHIHWRYVKWCDNKSMEPKYHVEFAKHFYKRFNKRKGDRFWSYFVDREPFIMDEDEIWIMNSYYRKQRGNRKQSGPAKGYWEIKKKHHEKV